MPSKRTGRKQPKRTTASTPKLAVRLPAPLRGYVDARVQEGGFGNAEEYLTELVREDQRRARERLESLAREGLNSGKPIRVDEAFWQERRAKLAAALARRGRRAG